MAAGDRVLGERRHGNVRPRQLTLRNAYPLCELTALKEGLAHA